MAAKFLVEYQGRAIEVIPDPWWEKDRVRLLVDGETVAESKANGPRTVLTGAGIEVRAVMPWWGGSVIRAELVPSEDGGEPLPLEPEPGTRAARRAAFERGHPRLYASRHVVSGAAKVAFLIIGLSLALRWLPSIPLPSIPLPEIHLPSIDLPEIPWPTISLPHVEVPGWIKAIAQSKPYWLPILLGVAASAGELRRRRRRAAGMMDRRDRGAGDAARPGSGTPASGG